MFLLPLATLPVQRGPSAHTAKPFLVSIGERTPAPLDCHREAQPQKLHVGSRGWVSLGCPPFPPPLALLLLLLLFGLARLGREKKRGSLQLNLSRSLFYP